MYIVCVYYICIILYATLGILATYLCNIYTNTILYHIYLYLYTFIQMYTRVKPLLDNPDSYDDLDTFTNQIQTAVNDVTTDIQIYKLYERFKLILSLKYEEYIRRGTAPTNLKSDTFAPLFPVVPFFNITSTSTATASAATTAATSPLLAGVDLNTLPIWPQKDYLTASVMGPTTVPAVSEGDLTVGTYKGYIVDEGMSEKLIRALDGTIYESYHYVV